MAMQSYPDDSAASEAVEETPASGPHPLPAAGGDAGTMTALLLFVGAVLGFTLVCTLPHEAADEGFHGPQIWNFFSGNDRIEQSLTTLPTYHFILGKIARAIGVYDLDLLRFLSATIALLCVPVFATIVRHTRRLDDHLRTVEFMFLPLAFPFFFLLYGDMWSLLGVLAMVMFTLKRRYALAALCGLCAVAIRQTAIVWLGFGFVLAVLADADTKDTFRWRRVAVQAVRNGWPFLLGFVLFAAFLAQNHGISMGDRAQHTIQFNPTNVYVLLICAWLIFLPYNLVRLPELVVLLRRPIAWVAFAAGWLLYLGTYRNTHQYNQPGLNFYLHNRLLALMTESLAWRALFYIPIVWMVLALATLRFPEGRLRSLLLFVPLSVCLHPLIEPRYFLPALVLLLAFRERLRPGAELATIAAYVPASAYIMLSIAKMSSFP